MRLRRPQPLRESPNEHVKMWRMMVIQETSARKFRRAKLVGNDDGPETPRSSFKREEIAQLTCYTDGARCTPHIVWRVVYATLLHIVAI